MSIDVAIYQADGRCVACGDDIEDATCRSCRKDHTDIIDAARANSRSGPSTEPS